LGNQKKFTPLRPAKEGKGEREKRSETLKNKRKKSFGK
jgi:hypothetical protein